MVPGGPRMGGAAHGVVLQAVVTVNPHEITGVLTACGVDPLFDAIVTSAELKTESKVAMAEAARELLGLPPGVASSLLIDNRADNCEEFEAAGGRAYHFTPDGFARDSPTLLGNLV